MHPAFLIEFVATKEKHRSGLRLVERGEFHLACTAPEGGVFSDRLENLK